MIPFAGTRVAGWVVPAIMGALLVALLVLGAFLRERLDAAEARATLAAEQRDAAVRANADLKLALDAQATAVQVFTDHAHAAQQLAAEALQQARAANQASRVAAGRLDEIARAATVTPASGQCDLILTTVDRYMRGTLK